MEPSGKAVLLLHGLGGSPAEMIYLKVKLSSAGYHVSVPQLPGHCTHFSDLKNITWQELTNFCRNEFLKLKANYSEVSVSGLCLGAVLALDIAAEFQQKVLSVIPISTTLFYDGWSLPAYAKFMKFFRYTPAYYFYNLPESEPYGIKDESMRKYISENMKDNSKTHYSKIPFKSFWQMHLLCEEVKKRVKEINSPLLAIHPLEDDVSSTKSVDFIQNNLHNPKLFRSLILQDSYHLATIDKERALVASSILGFLKDLSQKKTEPITMLGKAS
jgi:carboxylesterase